jgi:hypothetical protein
MFSELQKQMETKSRLKYIVSATILVLFVGIFIRFDLHSKLISGIKNDGTSIGNFIGINSSKNKQKPDIDSIVDLNIGNTPTTTKRLYKYIEVINSCGPHYEGVCVNARSGPATTFPATLKLRTGVVLRVADEVTNNEGRMWYKVVFDEFIRYPERIKGDLYVAADLVRVFEDQGETNIVSDPAVDTKWILVDISDQKLYAYDGETLFMNQTVSTGLELTPTNVGVFSVNRKTPSRYMQGPTPSQSDQFYDLPGVPWDLYFGSDGSVIHGAYWHNNFGRQWSHGCVNLPLDKARELYEWAPVGTPVVVRQ